MDKYFQMVEDILSYFPLECRVNYYKNKESLKIQKESVIHEKLYGTYDHDDNIITLYKDDALVHELFHMSFRDCDKVNQKIFDDEDLIYGNGVSSSSWYDGKKIVYSKGMTEGMVEYLTRKCGISIGKHFQYYFVDLLISIYGENILEYAFKNDPFGFFSDKRWVDIYKFSLELDKLDTTIREIRFISEYSKMINKIIEEGTDEEKRKISKLIVGTRSKLKDSIEKLFNSIVCEFNGCIKPNISSEEFCNKLNEFLVNGDYSFVFILDDKYFNLRKEIEDIIKKFRRDNKLIRVRKK